jgi:hypothetical protein
MIVGYARVSHRRADLDAQHEALTAAGAGKVYAEKMSGAHADPARYRYVFFAAPGYAGGRQLALETVQGVEVHCVEI